MVSDKRTPKEQFTIQIPPLKRFVDIFLSFLFLIILSPMMLIIILINWIEHRIIGEWAAPIFFYEVRISQGKKFKLLKFSIFKNRVVEEMRKLDPEVHSKMIEKTPGALLKSGYILKQTYMDELPQLFNILNGNLSFVGPRPVAVSVFKRRMLHGMNQKARIKAGVTGSWQSLKGMTDKSDRELEQEYIDFILANKQRQILWNDLKIIARTFKVLFKAKGI